MSIQIRMKVRKKKRKHQVMLIQSRNGKKEGKKNRKRRHMIRVRSQLVTHKISIIQKQLSNALMWLKLH
jgi:hypothetical protein